MKPVFVLMGKLLLSLSFLLTITLVTVSCKKEYSTEKGKLPEIAEWTIKDTLGNCFNAIVSGHYFSDKDPVTDSNFVTVGINVIKTGNYVLKTDVQNGFMFADSGIFANTGMQQVRLKISGKPLKDTLTLFNYSFDSFSCSFYVDVKKSVVEDTATTELQINTWEFTDSTNKTYHTGFVIPNPPGLVLGPNGYYDYTLMGAVTPTVPYDTTLYIDIKFPPPFIQVGTYSTLDHNYFSYISNTDNVNVYLSNSFTGGKLVIEIVDFNNQGRYIRGTFRGPAFDQNGNEVVITKGRFYANVFY